MDTRELIMQRLVAVCETVPGVTVFRNNGNVPIGKFPALVVRDGEEAAGETRHPYGLAPRRIIMNPTVNVIVSGLPEDVATILNGVRGAVIHAVLSDTTLAGHTHDNVGASYVGCQFAHEYGERVTGEIVLTFALPYILRPADLAPASGSASA